MSLLSACASHYHPGNSDVQIHSMTQLHDLACNRTNMNNRAWGINNLYDCKSSVLFIPYQLWTGAPWDGNKERPCMHEVDHDFNVNGDSQTTIKGPEKWLNKQSGQTEKIWVRKKINGSKLQYFTCHEQGIGRVYDSRQPRYYLSGRCKFPAGRSWKLAVRGYCKDTSIQITKLAFEANGDLRQLEFKWWYGDTFDHVYRYSPNMGMTHAFKMTN